MKTNTTPTANRISVVWSTSYAYMFVTLHIALAKAIRACHIICTSSQSLTCMSYYIQFVSKSYMCVILHTTLVKVFHVCRITYNSGQSHTYFYAYTPAIFNGDGGHIVSTLSVRTSVPSVLSVPTVTKMISVQYLLKRSVYWIQILYTGI